MSTTTEDLGGHRRAVATQVQTDLEVNLVLPVASLLGQDLHDVLSDRIRARTPQIVGQLLDPDDDHTAAGTGTDLMTVLWGDDDPPDRWWRTPLGRVCARVLTHDDTDAVTHSHAAALLGLARGTIASMVHRGTLDRHPDGGILRTSIMQRLARPNT